MSDPLPPDPRVPVTVITGFLGAGKTSLLRDALRHGALVDTALIVNEFGEVALDDLVLRSVTDRVAVLGGGCVCCSVLDDLAQTVVEMLDQGARGEIPAPRRIVIETSGLADPSPIVTTLSDDPRIQDRVRPDGVVTVLDAEHADLALTRNPEARRQVLAADLLVLNKTDLASPEALSALRARVTEMNPVALVDETSHGRVDPARWSGLMRRPLGRSDLAALTLRRPEARHSDGVRAFSLDLDGSVQWTSFALWLSLLTQMNGEGLLRFKALLHVRGEALPVLVHAVGHSVYPAEMLAAWPDEGRGTRMVFITQGWSDAFFAQVRDAATALISRGT